jgi:flagella basal body P-ring formation protein FlgA
MSPALLALLLCASSWADDDAIARLEQALQEHVAERLALAAEDVEILHLGVSVLPACAEDARILLESPPSERFRGHAVVRAELYGEEQLCTSLQLRTRVRAWVEAPVASTALEPGDEARWELDRVALERVTGAALDPAQLQQGRWLTRTTVAQGEPLTTMVLRPRPDGGSGDQVQVLAGNGTLLIETPGRLMADAFLGDTVRVANLATHGVHEGTLFAPGCVATGAVTARMKEVCSHVLEP